MMRISKPLFLTSIIAVFFLAGCQVKTEKKKDQEPIPVKVMRIEPQAMAQVLDYVGNIKAQDEVVVYPKVSGKIIEKVKEDGAPVAKDEVIAYIDRDEVGLKFERAPVESPLNGVVGRVYVDIGTNVSAQTPVALVVNMDKVKIDLEIPQRYLTKIHLGQEAGIHVDAYPEKKFTGYVAKISPVVDLVTRSAPVEISLENQEHLLKSGMFAKVSLVIEVRQNVPVVLKEAIIGKEPDTFIYVIENKKALLKKVSLGIRQGPYYEIKAGLKEGDLVVVMGQQRLDENAAVSIEDGNEIK